MKERIEKILDENLSVSDEWGGEKLAQWQFRDNVFVAGQTKTAIEIEKLFPKVYPVSVEPQEEVNYCIGKKNGKYLVVLGKYIKATDEHAKLMSITKSFWSVPNITPEYYIPESEFLKLLPEGIK